MVEEQMEESKSFAELFETMPKTKDRRFTAGETLSGKIVKISRETIFVDLGGKSEGIAGA